MTLNIVYSERASCLQYLILTSNLMIFHNYDNYFRSRKIRLKFVITKLEKVKKGG